MSPAANSVAADDGPAGPHIDLSQVQSRTVDFGSARTWDRNGDLQIHPAANKRDLFGLGPQANTASAGTRSGPEDRLRVERGDLGMLLVAQHGAHNDVQVMQGGSTNTSLIDQSGSHNAITGYQSGASNAASITQAGTNQIVAYVQSGTGSTLTVRQH